MVSGVINVRKERGMTSFGVVSRMRKIFQQKKIGHTGTLDPDAEGVLPVCLGKATHLVETLSRGTKSYRAVLLLGVTTDTQDASGNVIREAPVISSPEEIREAVFSFHGKQMQMPPMYSALKVNGKKLCDLARRGIEVERKAREVEFSEISVLDISIPRVTFEVTCTHGTYIRTLCHDIGEKLGCGGCMESLLRTRVEEFDLEDSLTLDEIAEKKKMADEEGRPYEFLLPIDHFYVGIPGFSVSGRALRAALNGQGIPASELRAICPQEGGALPGDESPEENRARVYTPDGALSGIYRKEGAVYMLEQYYFEG